MSSSLPKDCRPLLLEISESGGRSRSPSLSPRGNNYNAGGGFSSSSSNIIMRKKRLRTLLFLLLVILVLVVLMKEVYYTSKIEVGGGGGSLSSSSLSFSSLFKIPKHYYIRPSDFEVPKRPVSWYESTCYPDIKGKSISHIYDKLMTLKDSGILECSNIWKVFDTIFEIKMINASVVIPEKFEAEVKGWLGNDKELFKQLLKQNIYTVVLRGSHEETAFNPLRSRRPTSKSSVNPVEYIANLSSSTSKTCDFCSYKDHTAEDVFGRIDNMYSASASNVFKLGKFHGLFFPKTHHPLNISYPAIHELFVKTSMEWFEAANKEDSSQRYPTLLWDMLPHAGASQVHPHVHGILGSNHYTGGIEKFHALSQEYYSKHHRSFWTDVILVHYALGLGQIRGESVIIVPLFARKDHEYMIISPEVNQEFTSLVYTILQSYQEKLGVYCFSAGGSYHFMGTVMSGVDSYTQPGLPVTFRFGSRGVCTSVSSDVSSLELYTVNNINSDLQITSDALEYAMSNLKYKEPDKSS